MTARTRSLLIMLGLSVLVGIAYGNSFRSGFVLDNEFIIKEDPRLRAATWDNVRLIFTEDYWYPKGVGGLFRPLTTLSFLFDYSICGYGENFANYHWTNLALHWLNACLIYWLLRRMDNNEWVAFGSAALFAVHPIATESVTNLIGRADLLATSAVLGAMLIYLRSIEVQGVAKWAWLLLLAVITTLGVLAKENAIVIVAILPVYDLVFRYQGEWSIHACVQALWRWFWQGYVVLMPIVIGLFCLRYWMWLQNGPSMMAWGDNPLRATDFISSRLTAFKIIGYYLFLLVFPLRLSCDYTLNAVPNSSWRMSSIEDWKAVLAILVIVTLSVLLWRGFRRGRAAEVFFAAWFFLALLPTSNLIFLIDSNMAERFLYLPLIGLASCLVLCTYSWLSKLHRLAFPLTLFLVIILFAVRTHRRNDDWQTNVTLWKSATEVCPESFRAQRSLAWAMYKSEPENPDFDAFIPIAEKAASIARQLPVEQGDEKSHLMLGMYYGLKADRMSPRDEKGLVVVTDESRLWFEKSLVELEYAQTIGETTTAAQVQRLRAIGGGKDKIGMVGPTQVYENLWVTYSRLGRHADAAATLRKIQALHPATPLVYQSLPNELALDGKIREAGVVLLQSLILSLNHAHTPQQIAMVYDDPLQGIPLFVQESNEQRLNLQHPQVRQDFDMAIYQLVELFLQDEDIDSARQLYKIAPGFGCDPKPIERLIQEFEGRT